MLNVLQMENVAYQRNKKFTKKNGQEIERLLVISYADGAFCSEQWKRQCTTDPLPVCKSKKAHLQKSPSIPTKVPLST